MPRTPNVRRLPSGNYQGRYTAPDGRPRSRVFPTADQAGRWVTTQRGHVDAGSWVDPRNGRILYADWHTKWVAGRVDVRPTTLAKETSLAANHVLPSFGHLPLGHLGHAMIQDWVTDLLTRLSPSSVVSTVNVLKASLKAAADHRLIPANPAANVRLPRVEQQEQRFLDVSEVQALAEAIDPRYRAFVLLGCWAGLRIGEMIGLDRRHVGLTGPKATVRVERTASEPQGRLVLGPPKTARSRRTVTLTQQVRSALIEHLADFCGDDQDAPIFTGPQGTRLSATNFRNRPWRAATIEAGLPDLHPHEMRHTAIALWIRTGISLYDVSRMAGHSSIKITADTYGHLYSDAGDVMAARLDAFVAQAPSSMRAPLYATPA